MRVIWEIKNGGMLCSDNPRDDAVGGGRDEPAQSPPGTHLAARQTKAEVGLTLGDVVSRSRRRARR